MSDNIFFLTLALLKSQGVFEMLFKMRNLLGNTPSTLDSVLLRACKDVLFYERKCKTKRSMPNNMELFEESPILLSHNMK